MVNFVPGTATVNFRLFLAFRGTTRALLFAPYIQLFMVKVRSLSEIEYGVLQSLYYVTVVLMEVPSGILADRLGRKGILVFGAVANGAGCWVFAAAHDFWIFAVGEILFALGTAFISGADSALLYDSLAADQRQAEYPRAEGAAQAIWLGVTAIGFPLADRLLVRDGDPVLAYWITGALSFLGAAIALRLREPPVLHRLSTRQITAGALKDVWNSRAILRLIVYSILVFALLRMTVVMFFHPVLEKQGVPANYYGTVLAAMNVTGALLAWTAHGWMKRVGRRVVLVLMPLSILYTTWLLASLSHPAAAALFLVQGAAFGIYPLVIRSILNPLVPDARRRATILSLESLACRLAFAPMALFAGWALQTGGVDRALAATALLACLPVILLLFLRRDTATT